MRVLLVVNGFGPRGRFGTEFYAGELARGLRARGHDVAALCPGERDGSGRGYVEEADAAHGAHLFVVHAPTRSRALEHAWRDAFVESAFERLVERWRPDVVHVLQLAWGLSFAVPTIARAHGVRCVATLTDYGLLCHRGQMFDHRGERCGGPHPADVCAHCLRRPAFGTATPTSALRTRLADLLAATTGAFGTVTTRDVAEREAGARAALAAFDHVFVPSAPLADAFEGRAASIEPLVYAFDEQSYRAIERRRDPARLRLAFMGQLAPHKGAHVLLDAFARARRTLAERGVAAELALFGAAPAGRFAAWAQRLMDARPAGVRVEPSFEPGAAPRVLADVDALVVPSLWDENAPLVCLEARAAGVAVVGSRVPGIADVVEDGVHGLLAAPGDVAALAAALVAVDGLATVPRGLPLSLDAHLDRVERAYRASFGGA